MIPNFKSLQNNKISELPKLKSFANDNLGLNQMMKSVLESIENMKRRSENSGNQYFLLFLLCFQRPSLLGYEDSGLCGKELTTPRVGVCKK